MIPRRLDGTVNVERLCAWILCATLYVALVVVVYLWASHQWLFK